MHLTNKPENNNPKNQSNIGGVSSDLQKILHTPMTRNRDLNRAKEALPTLVDFVDYCITKKGSKKMLELCSGEGLLADDFQNLYNTGIDNKKTNILRADILGLEGRQTVEKTPLGGRINWKIDVQNLPKGLPDTYSIFGRQYIHNAPDLLEDLRNKLKVGSRAYIQFPEGIRSKKILAEFIQNNEEKNIAIYEDKTNPGFKSIIFEIRKESDTDPSLTIPKYHVKKDIIRYNKETGEKAKNSELFCHFFAENDTEREEIQKIMNTEIPQPLS